MMFCLSSPEKQAVLSLRVTSGNRILHLSKCLHSGYGCGCGCDLVVRKIGVTARSRFLFALHLSFLGGNKSSFAHFLIVLTAMLNDGVVRYASFGGICRRGSHKEHGTLPDLVELESVIPFDDLAVDVGDEK